MYVKSFLVNAKKKKKNLLLLNQIHFSISKKNYENRFGSFSTKIMFSRCLPKNVGGVPSDFYSIHPILITFLHNIRHHERIPNHLCFYNSDSYDVISFQ